MASEEFKEWKRKEIQLLKEKSNKVLPNITHKVCSECGEDKPVSDFTVLKTNKDGYRKQCKKCFAAIKKEKYSNKKVEESYYQRNKERIKERVKKYYEENKEIINAKRKENPQKTSPETQKKYYKKWAEKNKEKISEQRKRYYKENKEKILEKKKEYRENNLEKVREIARKSYHKHKKLSPRTKEPMYKILKRELKK